MIRLKSRHLAERSMSVGQQPGKPSWLVITVANTPDKTFKTREWGGVVAVAVFEITVTAWRKRLAQIIAIGL